VDRFQKSALYEPITDFLTKNRGFFILCFALPLSFLFDGYFRLRNWYVRKFLSTPYLHDQRVREVQEQVRRWNRNGRKKPMCTARPTWMTMSTRNATFKSDCSRISVNLHDILEVDTERQLVRCEPLVDMGQLSAHLTPMGYQLALMIEMEDLTVGGLLMGVGIEVNSHKHGFLTDTVESYELVLGDGSLARASRTENADLFYALPWSHGTLGFLVSVELKIIPCQSHMHLTYIPCHSQDEMEEKITALTQSPNGPNFVEMTIFSKDTAVIMTGEFDTVDTSEKKAKENHVNYWWKPWFYKHTETALTKGTFDEYIPLRHYIHRHTRSIFWELEDLIPFSNHWAYRYFLGWLGAPKVSFVKLTYTEKIRKEIAFKHVVQDVMVPLSELKNAIDLFDEIFAIYPLLFYTVRVYNKPEGLSGFVRNPRNTLPNTDPGYDIFFDLGAYGIPPAVKANKAWDAIAAVRKMEKFTRDVGGYQMMYADNFMNREEFEE
ncbi:FAD-binding domain-containing protein, partial [Basidiobolus meristosporus CBS 931.73]